MSRDLEKIDKKWLLVNSETGEILPVTEEESLNIRYREDIESSVVNRRDGYKKKIQRDEFQKYINNELGGFNFCFYLKLNNLNLRPQILFRFVYLCTFTNYNNELIEGRKNFTRKTFNKVLCLSVAEVKKTLKELKETNLLIEKEGKYMIDNNICKRGRLNKKEKQGDFTRVFDKGVKELYEQALPREHKLLSSLISLLPHVNREYNIVCYNPEEKNLKKINMYNFNELADELGYKNSRVMKKELLKIKVGGQYALALVMIGGSIGIYINPKLYYKGSDIEQLKVIIATFDNVNEKQV